MRLESAAAALTAIAYSVETSQHGIFEKGMVHMAALFFILEDLDRFVGGDPP